jgi:hypothetical protein
MSTLIYLVDVPHEIEGNDCQITTVAFATRELAEKYVADFAAVFEADLLPRNMPKSLRDWIESRGKLYIQEQEVFTEDYSELLPVRVFSAVTEETAARLRGKIRTDFEPFTSHMCFPRTGEAALDHYNEIFSVYPDADFIKSNFFGPDAIPGSVVEFVGHIGEIDMKTEQVKKIPMTIYLSLDEEALRNAIEALQ